MRSLPCKEFLLLSSVNSRLNLSYPRFLRYTFKFLALKLKIPLIPVVGVIPKGSLSPRDHYVMALPTTNSLCCW